MSILKNYNSLSNLLRPYFRMAALQRRFVFQLLRALHGSCQQLPQIRIQTLFLPAEVKGSSHTSWSNLNPNPPRLTTHRQAWKVMSGIKLRKFVTGRFLHLALDQRTGKESSCRVVGASPSSPLPSLPPTHPRDRPLSANPFILVLGSYSEHIDSRFNTSFQDPVFPGTQSQNWAGFDIVYTSGN